LHYIRLSFDIITKVTYESIYFKEEEEQLVRCDLSQNSLSLPRPKGFGLKPQTFSALLLSSLLSASSTPDSFQNCRFARPNQPTHKQTKQKVE